MNYLSLVVAVIAGGVVGVIWYGPLFGSLWQSVSRYSDKELKEEAASGFLSKISIHAVGLVVSAFVLSYFIVLNGATSFVEGATVGFLVWVVGAIVVVLTGAMHRSSRHESVHVVMIDLGHWLAVFVSMGGVLGLF